MTPIARSLYVPSVATAAVGTALAMLGVLLPHRTLWAAGLLAAVAAIPVLCYCLIHRATQASDDQLAEAHTAGYRLALQHVHMGLLDSPAAPPDGGEGVAEEDTQGISIIRSADLPDNVWLIRARDKEDDDRKAV